MSTSVDQKVVKELFDLVQAQKEEISKAEKPNWLTNCSFAYDAQTSNKFNIRTVSSIETLTDMLAFILGKERDFNEANKILGTDSSFSWLGFSKNDWVSDFKTRVNQLSLSKKKEKLEIAETRLNKLVSKEVREQMELQELMKELKG